MNTEPVKRHIVPKPGLSGWAHGERGHGLPEGLPHKTPLVVLERSGWRDLIVRATVGGVWQVREGAVDCGTEYRTRSGEWIPESDERARRYLIKFREAIHTEDRKKVYVHSHQEKERMIREIEWILERNGWEVPPLPAQD